jgi:large subunit ribosomal protein L21
VQSRSEVSPLVSTAGAVKKDDNMYAVIRTGGKQYRVAAGETVEVEKLPGAVGDTVTITDVLMIADGENVQVGQPVVEGASVTARITGQYRGDKIMVFKYRPKKRIRVRKGHRQYITRLQIGQISA